MSLVQFANQLSRVIIPIIIIAGIVSNSLNIVVLTRPTLYQNACSRYFLAHTACNLFYLSIILTYRLLADQYHIDPTKDSVVLCKIIVYVNHVGIFMAPTFVVLASIDRWCASSTNVQPRKLSSIKIARWMILFTIILFLLFFINSAILVNLQNTDPYGCRIRADTVYKQIYVFVQASMVSFISPILMTFFGLMTIYNIKMARVQPVTISRNRRTGNQLANMLLIQVSTHIILNMSTSITYLIFVLSNDLKTTPGFIFATTLAFLSFHVSYVTAFFLYTLSAQIYRKELIRLKNRLSVLFLYYCSSPSIRLTCSGKFTLVYKVVFMYQY